MAIFEYTVRSNSKCQNIIHVLEMIHQVSLVYHDFLPHVIPVIKEYLTIRGYEITDHSDTSIDISRGANGELHSPFLEYLLEFGYCPSLESLLDPNLKMPSIGLLIIQHPPLSLGIYPNIRVVHTTLGSPNFMTLVALTKVVLCNGPDDLIVFLVSNKKYVFSTRQPHRSWLLDCITLCDEQDISSCLSRMYYGFSFTNELQRRYDVVKEHPIRLILPNSQDEKVTHEHE